MAKGSVVGVQVDIESVLVIQRVMLPPKLDVGDFQGIANGLDSVGTGALGRSKYCYDPQSELVTGWKRKGGREGGRERCCQRVRGTSGFFLTCTVSGGGTDKLLGTNSSMGTR